MSKGSITSKLLNMCMSLYSDKFPTAPLEKFRRTLMFITIRFHETIHDYKFIRIHEDDTERWVVISKLQMNTV